VGRSVARIDADTMKAIGVTVGDVIEIKGKRTTPARVWSAYPEDVGLGLVRIDGFLRKNCGVSLNEYVIINRAVVNHASSLTLAPVDIRINVDNDFTRFVKDRLIDRPVIRGDTILIMMLGHSVPFIVVSTRPTGIVKISPITEVNVLGHPVVEAAPPIPGIAILEKPHDIYIEKCEDLESLIVSFGKIESEFDPKEGRLIINCEVILSFRTEGVSGILKHYLREDEVLEWRDIVDRRQKAIEDELKSLKASIKKLLDASSIRPMRLPLSELLDELVVRTSET